MARVSTGIMHWTAPHPEWRPGYDWPEDVSSFALDDGEQLLLFDPLDPPEEVLEQASARTTAIVLTSPWHARDGVAIARELSASLYVPPPDVGDPEPLEGIVYRLGETLPVGAHACRGAEPNDLVLWVPSRGVLVVGDTLVDRGDGLEFPRDWAQRNGYDPDVVLAGLQPLLELPVERLLATHGGVFDRAALQRALAA